MRHRKRTLRFGVAPLVAVALALSGAACGGGGDGDDDEQAEETDEEPAEGRNQDSPGFEDLQASDDLDVESTDDDDDVTDGDFTDEEFTGDTVTVEDDTGSLFFDVPEDWSDVDGSIVIENPDTGETSGVGIAASPDLDAYNAAFDVPGVFFGADVLPAGVDTDALVSELLVNNTPNEDGPVCTLDTNEEPYDDGFYVGAFDVYTDCGGTGAVTIVLAAVSEGNEGFDDYFIVLVGQVVTPADADALDTVVLTSIYTP